MEGDLGNAEYRISGSNEIVTALVQLPNWWLVTDDAKGPRWIRACALKRRHPEPSPLRSSVTQLPSPEALRAARQLRRWFA